MTSATKIFNFKTSLKNQNLGIFLLVACTLLLSHFVFFHDWSRMCVQVVTPEHETTMDVIVPPKAKYALSFREALTVCSNKTSVPLFTGVDRPVRMYVHQADTDQHVSAWVISTNGNVDTIFEHHMQRMMLEVLSQQDDPLILDIGANIGVHSVLLAARGYEVHSFEPFKDNFEILQCSAVINQFDPERFRIHNYGFSNEDYTACMGVELNNYGHAWVDHNATCENGAIMKRLDQYLESLPRPPFLVKIDIEGHEMLALSTGESYFQRHPPAHIFSEYSPTFMKNLGLVPMDYLRFFWRLGYTLRTEEGLLIDEAYGENLTTTDDLYNFHAYREVPLDLNQ